MRRALLVVCLAACGGGSRPAPADPSPAPAVENEAETVAHSEPLHWEEFEREFMMDLIGELRATSERENHPRLGELVVKVETLIRQAEHGELTQRLLLEEYEELLVAMTDPIEEWVAIQLDDLRALLRKARVGPARSPFSEP